MEMMVCARHAPDSTDEARAPADVLLPAPGCPPEHYPPQDPQWVDALGRLIDLARAAEPGTDLRRYGERAWQQVHPVCVGREILN